MSRKARRGSNPLPGATVRDPLYIMGMRASAGNCSSNRSKTTVTTIIAAVLA